MTTAWLSLRERARRLVRLKAYDLGLVCGHVIQPSLWRPVLIHYQPHPDPKLNVGVWLTMAPQPGRACEQCDRVELVGE